MSIKDGLNAVDPTVRKLNRNGVIDPALYGPFAHVVMERAAKDSLLFEEKDCNESYNKDCHEIHMWFFGLMLCEYVAGIIEQKVRDGHCGKHRNQPDLLPCSTMRKKHHEMLQAFKNDLKKLVEEIDLKIANLDKEFCHIS